MPTDAAGLRSRRTPGGSSAAYLVIVIMLVRPALMEALLDRGPPYSVVPLVIEPDATAKRNLGSLLYNPMVPPSGLRVRE